MNRVELAFRAFFWVFFNGRFASRVGELFEPKEQETVEAPKPAEVKAAKSRRSEALQIISLLQREGRLVDFLQEPMAPYSDAQIGAAVRDIHRDCGAALNRVFGVQPLVDKEENARFSVLPGYDPELYRLTGKVTGNPPYDGVLRHHGWRATKCDLPTWEGSDEAAEVIAPAEIELS